MSQLSLFDPQTCECVSWSGNRNSAFERLDVFLPRAGRLYAASRNYDYGPRNRANISCLSPWIRHRLLLEEEVLAEILKYHSLNSAEKFIQEVFWRSYFKGWLEQRPSVWLQYRLDVKKMIEKLDLDVDLAQRYKTATCGKTGIGCFDAWATELVSTGYLHNHARMWFASIWMFELRLPWQLGADFFYRHLLDADPASNTLSWRWVAGLHTKGKNYIARRSNIEKFTAGRFSPEGLISDSLPLTENHEHPLQPVPQSAAAFENSTFGLLVTQEDCYPESLPISGTPKGICGLLSTCEHSMLARGKPAQEFATEAFSNALKRAEQHFECPAIRLDDSDHSDPEEWGALLVDWAQRQGVKTLVTAWVPVGPIREKLDEALPTLNQANITLLQVLRPYDRACWPHATGSFFKLRAKIPSIIKALGFDQLH